MQSQSNPNLSTLKVHLKMNQESLKKTRNIMEKRGKSHLNKVHQVIRKIALEDLDYVSSKLDFKDEEAPVVAEDTGAADPFE